jgi:hypothetical protein
LNLTLDRSSKTDGMEGVREREKKREGMDASV